MSKGSVIIECDSQKVILQRTTRADNAETDPHCGLTPPLVSSDCVVDRGKSFLSLAEFYRQIPPENWPSCDVCSSP